VLVISNQTHTLRLRDLEITRAISYSLNCTSTLSNYYYMLFSKIHITRDILIYYINTGEIPAELLCVNLISSHVKITSCCHKF